MNVFIAVLFKIVGVAFKQVGLVGAQNIYIARLKALHTGAGNEGAFAFYDPGKLRFIMAVQVIVKMGQLIFLNHNGMLLGNRYGELNNFHVQ